MLDTVPTLGQATHVHPCLKAQGHEVIDLRSLAFHTLICEKIKQQDQIVRDALLRIERWRSTASTRLLPVLAEWETWLQGPQDQLLSMLVSRNQESTRLRQSSPFAGVLSTQERTQILRRFPL
jgi:hypothetical protein